MAIIHNTDLIKELKEGAKLQQLRDVIPSQLADKVVPTMETNPKLLRRCNISKTTDAVNATSGTIYTTPSDKDFFLVSCCLGVIKDATSTSTGSNITVVIDGVSSPIARIPGITLTAQSKVVSCTFPAPIKIDRGTNITVTASTNVANIRATGVITGYLVENINA